jgi:hypothetical protein
MLYRFKHLWISVRNCPKTQSANTIFLRQRFRPGPTAFSAANLRSIYPPSVRVYFGHHSLPNPIVAKILDTLYRSELIKAEKPPIDASLLDQTPEYTLHMGSEQYRQRNKPLIAGDFIDYLEKILAISATVFGGLLFAGQIYLRNARQQRETRLTHYMERVLTIEKDLLDSESAARLELPKLLELQRELADLKSDAIKRFASGELHGETMIQGFLALVNDARNQLTRLILHERENIEQRAIEQNASPETLWNQQMKMGCDDIDIG